MRATRIFPVTLFVILAFVIAACAPVAPSPGQPAAAQPAEEPITLTVMASQGWIKDAELELAKKFEEETGIHVDYQILPADQYFTVLKTKLNAGEATDIFAGQSGKSDLKVMYDVEKNAVELTNEEWVSRQDPLTLDAVSLDGKVYGLEIWDVVSSNYFVINYNKKIFEQLGLSVPNSYAEFKEACLKIQEAGITPIYEPVADGWHHVLWFPMIGPRFEELNPGLAEKLNRNEIKFADVPIMLEALQQLQEMYELGFFGENALSDTVANTTKMLASGQYAMSLATLTTPTILESEYPEVSADTFGFFPIPLADNRWPPANPAGPSKFIYSGSPHIEEAKEYFRFLTRPENLQYLIDNTPDFAMLNFTGLKSQLTPAQEEFLETYPAGGIVYQTAVTYVNPQWMDMGKDLVAMFTGTLTPEGVLRNIDQRRADMAIAAKDPFWVK
ncbi:MAG: extracellular solute-binding protein [Anaerolineae bacterium]